MTPSEIEMFEIENYSRLQRIKKDNGDANNPTLDYEIRVSAAKLEKLGVNLESLNLWWYWIKEGITTQTNEKEIYVYLMNMRDVIEDGLEIAKEENAEKTIKYLEKELKRVNEKIYQNPPVS